MGIARKGADVKACQSGLGHFFPMLPGGWKGLSVAVSSICIIIIMCIIISISSNIQIIMITKYRVGMFISQSLSIPNNTSDWVSELRLHQSALMRNGWVVAIHLSNTTLIDRWVWGSKQAREYDLNGWDLENMSLCHIILLEKIFAGTFISSQAGSGVTQYCGQWSVVIYWE